MNYPQQAAGIEPIEMKILEVRLNETRYSPSRFSSDEVPGAALARRTRLFSRHFLQGKTMRIIVGGPPGALTPFQSARRYEGKNQTSALRVIYTISREGS